MSNERIEFDFEKLEVYQLALGLLDQFFIIHRGLSHDLKFSLGDQLIRAGLSISNNIAEGSGKVSPKEKARYYTTALDSTRECVSIVTVLRRQALINQACYELLRVHCWRISSMLFRLRSAVKGR